MLSAHKVQVKKGKGTCTTKHAVIATLADELGLPVQKHIGIYAMTEAIVGGTRRILGRYRLPYVPMVHCFLASDQKRVDLTEGNRNGKEGPIDEFLHIETVEANISAKNEYMRYRKVLEEKILHRPELQGRKITTVLKARAEGLDLLKANVAEYSDAS